MAATHVQFLGQNAIAAASTTIGLTLGVTVPVGDHVILGISDNGSTSITVTDSKGNTYQTDRSQTTTARVAYIASGRITTQLVASDVITVTYSASVGARRIAADQFNGLATSSWFDQSNSQVSSSIAPDSGNITTTQASEMLYGATAYAAAGVNMNPGSTGGNTFIETSDFNSGTGTMLQTQYVFQTVTGTYSNNGLITSTTWTCLVASYKAAVTVTTRSSTLMTLGVG